MNYLFMFVFILDIPTNRWFPSIFFFSFPHQHSIISGEFFDFPEHISSVFDIFKFDPKSTFSSDHIMNISSHLILNIKILVRRISIDTDYCLLFNEIPLLFLYLVYWTIYFIGKTFMKMWLQSSHSLISHKSLYLYFIIITPFCCRHIYVCVQHMLLPLLLDLWISSAIILSFKFDTIYQKKKKTTWNLCVEPPFALIFVFVCVCVLLFLIFPYNAKNNNNFYWWKCFSFQDFANVLSLKLLFKYLCIQIDWKYPQCQPFIELSHKQCIIFILNSKKIFKKKKQSSSKFILKSNTTENTDF